MIWNLIPLSLVSRLFIIIDPLGSMPLFLVTLRHFSATKARQITLREMSIALVVMLTFVFVGSQLLHLMAVDPKTMGVSGGSVLFVIAFHMLFNQQSEPDSSKIEEPFIFPLAIPLVVGPAVFATLVDLDKVYSMAQIISSLLAVWALSTPILLAAPSLQRYIGQGGIKAIEKLMGLVLLALSIQMSFDGITEFYRF